MNRHKMPLLALLFLLGCNDMSVNPGDDGRWIYLGLKGKDIIKLKITSSYINACAGLDGLFRHSKFSLADSWEYIGLGDTTLINGIDTTKGCRYPKTQGVTDVVINPHNEDELLASILTPEPNVPGIYKSTNGGKTWFESDSGYGFDMPWWWYPADSGRIRGAMVLFNPANQFNIIFAGHSDAGVVYRTTNSGVTWAPVLVCR